MATINDFKKLCRSYESCEECLFFNYNCGGGYIHTLSSDMNEMVDKWVEEHPIKTYLQDFFKKFPEARKRPTGEPMICPHQIYYGIDNECYDDCLKCWNQEVKKRC